MIFDNLVKKVFGTRNDRLLKEYRQSVLAINALEAGLEKLSDEALRSKTDSFKQRVSQGESIDDLLPEAFAVVREAGRRVLQLRHFDEQLIGGMALHYGKIAEMRTGEGKTLQRHGSSSGINTDQAHAAQNKRQDCRMQLHATCIATLVGGRSGLREELRRRRGR